jgi:uncharacterized membrane protein
MEEESHKTGFEKEEKQINKVYAAMAGMLIFSCVPFVLLQILAFILLLYGMMKAYRLRARSAEDSMTHNHMEFLIRTFWISSLFFLIGFAGAVVYLMKKLDLNAVNNILNSMENGMMTGQFVLTPDIKTLAIVSVAAIGPSIVYFIYRIAKGFARSLQGYRIGNVKAWF